MNAFRSLPIGSILAGLLLAGGCATANQPLAVNGPGKDLARKWARAAKEPLEPADTRPEPEPRLLPATHFSAGNLYEKQGNYPLAVEQYQKAIELNKAFPAACDRLGLCYTKMGHFDQAVQALERATDLQPDSPRLWNNLGFACLGKRDYARAEQCLDKALRLQPGFAHARLNMAIVLVQGRRDAEALAHIRAICPEPIAHYDLGAMQLAAGRPLEARASFEKALHLQADFPAADKGRLEAEARLAGAATASVRPAVTSPAQAAAQVNRPDPAQAKAGPTTRPIVGIDDEPALANAPARCFGGRPGGVDTAQEVVIRLPVPTSYGGGT